MSIMDDTKQKMLAAIDHYKKELRNLRTGRANPGMLEDVKVEVYGTEMNIKSLANVTVAESRQLLVTPFDPQTLGPIAKGIEKANLGLQAIAEGNVIRVPVPPLNEEVRKELVKQAKKKSEDAKVTIREVRRKSNETVRKQKSDGDIPEDMMKKLEKQIQDETDSYCKQVDEIFSEKQKDILEV